MHRHALPLHVRCLQSESTTFRLIRSGQLLHRPSPPPIIYIWELVVVSGQRTALIYVKPGFLNFIRSNRCILAGDSGDHLLRR